MATGRSRGPASRPPRRPAGGALARVRPRGGARRHPPPCPHRLARALHRRGPRPAHPARPGAAVDPRVPHRAARLDRRGVRRAAAGHRRDARQVTAPGAGRRSARDGAGALARPRLRRAAGTAAAEVRQAGRGSYTVLDAEPSPTTEDPVPAVADDRRRRRCRGTPRSGSRRAPPTPRERAGDRASAPAARRPGRPRRRLPPAGPRRARRRRGRAPLPVRRARRRADRAAAARRHAVPDLLLRDLSPAHRRAVDPGEPGRHARDD